MVNINLLKLDLFNTLNELKADLSIVENIFVDLVTAYADSNRKYHNLQHIEHLLGLAKSVESIVECLPVIKLSVWFHDFVYDSQRQDNELQSAIYAEKILIQLNIAPHIIQAVIQLILSTQKHEPLLDGIDNLIFLDLDLEILGSSKKRYRQYTQSIRQEYNWLGDRDYCQARKRVLTSFLAREKIYYTDYFFQTLEQLARNNLTEEIQLLSQVIP